MSKQSHKALVKSNLTVSSDGLNKDDVIKVKEKKSFVKRVYEGTRLFWITVIAIGLFSSTFRSSSMSKDREILIGAFHTSLDYRTQG
jgi:hypothetical protein